jgi:FKBP-type peptidyl-prolyl cis-trans isomerase FklB
VEFRGQILARRQGERVIDQGNKKEGDTFLAANKTKEGVIALPSGLQYKVLKTGEGRKPTVQDTVQIHYRGTLINGTQFESTYETGKPATIKIFDPQIVPGMREALMLMTQGSKWQLFVPPKLAYSTVGKHPYIGPNMTLIYEVELLAIQEPGKAGGQ